MSLNRAETMERALTGEVKFHDTREEQEDPNMSSETDGNEHKLFMKNNENCSGDKTLSAYAGQGDPEIWNNIWKCGDVGINELYTEGTPQNLGQLVQRGYFDDLWYFMGDTGSSARYLEVGAGRGTTAMYLSKQNCDVTMLDLSAEGFRIAEINFKRHGLRLPKMITADAQSTGLPSCSYDCVYSIGLLEHFLDPKPLLLESFRLLKPGGLLFKVIVPKQSVTRAWLPRLLLNPMGYGVDTAKHMVKKIIGYTSPEDKTISTTRTNYPRSLYAKWMQELGAVNVLCIPYVPYRRAYRNEALEKEITLPLYRRHYFRKKRARIYPILRTHWSAAFCDLLVCRKAILA
jgi:ubiquinone/menaquinone biosynthesis C-methylase UbiE